MVTEVYSNTIEDVLRQEEYSIVDFYGDHCGACVVLAPVYNEASNRFAMIGFHQANADQDKEIADRFQIKGLPTLLFFRSGELVHKAMGAMDMETLKGHIAKMLYE